MKKCQCFQFRFILILIVLKNRSYDLLINLQSEKPNIENDVSIKSQNPKIDLKPNRKKRTKIRIEKSMSLLLFFTTNPIRVTFTQAAAEYAF